MALPWAELIQSLNANTSEANNPWYQTGASMLAHPAQVEQSFTPRQKRPGFWQTALTVAPGAFLGGAFEGAGTKLANNERDATVSELADFAGRNGQEATDFLSKSQYLKKNLPGLGLIRAQDERATEDANKKLLLEGKIKGLQEGLVSGTIGHEDYLKSLDSLLSSPTSKKYDEQTKAPAESDVATADGSSDSKPLTEAQKLAVNRLGMTPEEARAKITNFKSVESFAKDKAADRTAGKLSDTTLASLGDIVGVIDNHARIDAKLAQFDQNERLNNQIQKRIAATDRGKVESELRLAIRQLGRSVERGRLSDPDAAIYDRIGRGDLSVSVADARDLYRNMVDAAATQTEGQAKTFRSAKRDVPQNVFDAIEGFKAKGAGAIGSSPAQILSPMSREDLLALREKMLKQSSSPQNLRFTAPRG